MASALTKVANNTDGITQKLLRTFIKLMTLLATTFTPYSAQCCVVVDYKLKLFGFFSLMQNSFNHATAFL